MKRRAWLIDALRLHFDEHLSRIEAGRRLGIPKSTVCDLFIRFRRHDLTWPVPGSMTCRKLEKILYPQRLPASPLAPDIAVPAETLSSGKHRRRPNFPREFKIALVERSLQPDVSVLVKRIRTLFGKTFVHTSSVINHRWWYALCPCCNNKYNQRYPVSYEHDQVD